VAEVHRVRLPFTSTINLACSGARTRHVLRASAGGESLKTEPPQNDQLAQVARTHRVSVIVLSIGGNDLGFSDIIQACLSAYFAPAGPPCAQTQQPLVNERMVTTRADVGRTIDDVRATMAQAGYRHSSYRLVLQSYPAPQPAAADMRYGADDPQRLSVGNCPFRDPDVDWAHDQLVNQLDDMLRGVARDRQVQFLDVRDAFRGHELCSASARHSDGTPREATSEWVRWIDLPQQGDLFSESLHPNAYGHRALGRCLNMAVYTRVDVSCHGVPGLSTSWMYLRRLR
jgi:lysophospholipase L1-like esterase